MGEDHSKKLQRLLNEAIKNGELVINVKNHTTEWNPKNKFVKEPNILIDRKEEQDEV